VRVELVDPTASCDDPHTHMIGMLHPFVFAPADALQSSVAADRWIVPFHAVALRGAMVILS